MTLPAGDRLGPYEVTELLGSGSMGEVYRATDQRLGRHVALKLLPRRTDSEQAVIRFLREARTASALDHPNIVSIHDVGEAEAGRFIVMELIKGRILREVMAEKPPFDTLAHIGSQIAKALAVSHAAGIVHRDIKPENVMVRFDGYVKVLDFGLAQLSPTADAARDELDATTPGLLVGTVSYMSPEQVQSEPLTTATDIFSLGIVLFEAFTGEHPFPAKGLAGKLAAILSQPAPPASKIVSDLPGALDGLLLQMLAKDPELRPTAGEVDEVLATLARKQVLAPPVVVAKTEPTASTVGRERERRELDEAFAQASERGQMVGLAGEAGLGKTTLAEDFLNELESTGVAWVGRGRSAERLAGTEAYLPFLEALEGLLYEGSERGSERSMARTMKLFAPTWYGQVVPMTTEESLAEGLMQDIKSASQERLKRELAAYLTEVSRLRPLVLFFDDVHWADASTVDLLTYLSGRITGMRILILVTYRPSDLHLEGHPFQYLKLDLQGRSIFREIELEYLDRGEVELCLDRQFPQHHFPAGFLDLIYSKTEGSPLFLTDLLRDLRNRGVIDEVRGTWQLVRSLAAVERELPQSVRSMVELKISRLQEEDRRLLACAAVYGQRFDSAVLASALKLDPADVEERLASLERVHAFIRLLRETELPDRTLTVRYRFHHAMYQSALWSDMTPSRKASLAAAVAAALAEHYREKQAAVISRLAFLYETARDAARATEHYLAAARNAGEIFANQEILELSRRGLEQLEYLPPGEERDQLELGFMLVMGGPLMSTEGYGSAAAEKAFGRARELSEKLGQTSLVFMMLDALAVIKGFRGEYRTTLGLAEELLEVARRFNDPTVSTEAHWVMASTLWSLGDFVTARQHCEEGLEAYDLDHVHSEAIVYSVDPAVCCHCGLGLMSWPLGEVDRAAESFERAVSVAQDLQHPESLALALFVAAIFEQYRGDVPATRERADASAAISSEHGLVQTQVFANLLRAWARCRESHAEEGVAEIRRHLETLREMSAETLRPYFLGVLAEGLVAGGELDEAASALTEALDEIEYREQRTFLAEILRQRGELFLRLERPEDGEHDLRRAVEVARSQRARSFELRASLALARARGGEPSNDAAQVLSAAVEGFPATDLLDELAEARALLQDLA